MNRIQTSAIARERRKGRGAFSNETGRFERLVRVEQHDDWDIPEERARFKTEISHEAARSLITYNRSPDLPFDRSINMYRGCEHGCIYCFARPSHAFLGLSPGLDFETKLVAKPNAAEILERELRSKSYVVRPIAIGTNTDPYQPIEKDAKIMRACLKVLAAFNHPVAIVTKGTLIERDIDILAPMAKRGLARVGISMTSLDRDLARKMEPRVPSPARKLQTIARLNAAGIPVRVMVSPIIPALTDPEVERILKAAKGAGAQTASWIMLRLPREVSPLFEDWLKEHFPDRANRVMSHLRDMHGGKSYDAQWHKRMRGSGPYAELIAQRFNVARRAVGLESHGSELRCDLFQPPLGQGDQLALF